MSNQKFAFSATGAPSEGRGDINRNRKNIVEKWVIAEVDKTLDSPIKLAKMIKFSLSFF